MEMITTCNVCTVSDGGCDVKFLKEPLTFNSGCCSSQASMNALIHMMEHANKSYKTDCLGWEDVISGARNPLTCRDLGRFVALCNDDHDAIEGEYHLYKEWWSLFLGHPTCILIRNGVEGHKEDEGSDKESWSGGNEINGR